MRLDVVENRVPREKSFNARNRVSTLSTCPVLLVGNFWGDAAGTRQTCQDLAQRLWAAGCPVLTTSSQAGHLARLADMVFTAWRERNRYKVAHVDVFSGRSFFWAEAVCRLFRVTGKPYVLTLHGGRLPSFAKRWPRRVRNLLGPAASVIAPSSYLAAQLRPYRHDLRVLPNAIDLSKYPFLLRTTAQPRLVWLRGFRRLYNPELAPRVLKVLLGEFPGIHLTMYGPDKDGSLSETQEMARRLGVSSHISFPGPVAKSRVPESLNEADIFLNTTNVDNTPVSVIEAMACGLCIVSTAVGGIPYLLEDQTDALLVPPDDPEAMAAAVRRILTERALAEQLSHMARRKVQEFDWSVVLPQWEELLSGVGNGVRNG